MNSENFMHFYTNKLCPLELLPARVRHLGGENAYEGEKRSHFLVHVNNDV